MPPLSEPKFFRESGCKGTANSATHQIFSQLFFEKSKVFRFLDANQGITMADTFLYIRARDYVRMRKTTFSDLENNVFWLGKQRFLTWKIMFSDSENSISCPVAYAKAQQKDDCRHNMDLDKCLPTWQGRPIKTSQLPASANYHDLSWNSCPYYNHTYAILCLPKQGHCAERLWTHLQLAPKHA